MPHKDKAARNEYHRAYYKRHKALLNSRVVSCHRARREVLRVWVQQLKASKPCASCGIKVAPYALDFDHRNPDLKVADVSTLVRQAVSLEVLKAEVAKCDLICVCCHRLRTYKGSTVYRTRRFAQNMAALDRLKESLPCLDCGTFFKACQMDFDHVSGVKVSNVSQMVGRPSVEIEVELDKCQLVCANCHRVRTQTGVRPGKSHQEALSEAFRRLRGGQPEDRRKAPFPFPHLLGEVPDKVLSGLTGMSVDMVSWHRRRAGIVLRSRTSTSFIERPTL